MKIPNSDSIIERLLVPFAIVFFLCAATLFFWGWATDTAGRVVGPSLDLTACVKFGGGLAIICAGLMFYFFPPEYWTAKRT